MTETDPNVVLHDHLPDGTTLGEMPFHDSQAMAELLCKRMPQETLLAVYKNLAEHLLGVRQQGA
ncbi:hypothetical protein [Streptomyces werraensis]|uniref:hypothetical protein n=1 Tax=Streptomyces werraensis TaxID=68284 RepID=UPI00343DB43C